MTVELHFADNETGKPMYNISGLTYVEGTGEGSYYIEHKNGGTMEVRGVQITQIQKE